MNVLLIGRVIQNNNRKMIQFDRIRKSSVVRDKVYYLCNHIKFYSIKDPLVTAFYFLTQSLALISTFIASPLASATSASSLLQSLNNLFFFYNNDLYMRYDTKLLASHLVSLLLFGSFAVVGYFTYKLDHRNHLAMGKGDRKRIRVVEAVVFFMMIFSIPLGSFMWYYIMRLFELNMEYLAIISLANLICLFVLVYVAEECSIESDLKNYQSLSRLYSKNESVHAIVKMMVRMTISSFNNLTNSIIILSLLALLLFDLYELRSCLTSKKYLDSTTQSLYYYKNVATVILEMLMLVCLITSFPLIVNNFFLSVLSTSLLAYLALSQFKNNKKMTLILDGLDAVNTEDDAKIYMLEMIAMLDASKNSEEVFTLSLVTIHKDKCKADNCFCRSISFEGFSKLSTKGEFLKRFVLSKLQGTAEKFASSFLILSILLNYKLSMMSCFSKIYYLLKTYTQKNQQALQSFSQQYMLYQVQIIIQKEIHRNNADRFVQVQKTFKEDELKANLTHLIAEANDAFSVKYRLLGQEICNLNVISQLCLRISNLLRAIEAIWRDFQQKDSYNLKIYQIFLIYFQYIIFSKKQAALMKTTIIRKTQALQHLKGISQDNIERYLYTDKACVIETIFNKDRVGIVTNITSSCQQVFKITRDQILQKDIHELMPDYFASDHRKWTQEWFDGEVLTGKILGLVNTSFVDAAGNCFTCSLHMKVTSVGFKLRFYIMLIRDNSSDYMLLNNALEIQGIGSKIQGEQIFQMSCLKKPIMEYTDANLKPILNQVTEGGPIKRRIVFRNQSNLNQNQKQMAYAILGASSEVCMKEPPQAYVYQCQVLFQRRSVSKFNYYMLKFMEIRKLVKHSNGYFFKTISTSKNYDSIKGSKSDLCQLSQRTNQVETDPMLKSSQSDIKSEDGKFQVHNMSSVAESALGQGNIMFSKLAQEIKDKSVNPHKVTDKRLNYTTVLIVLMIGVVAGSACLQSYLFSLGISSYSQLIFSSAAVSSNNQLLKTIFNYAMNLHNYCSNDNSTSFQCQQTLERSRGLSKKVYGYMIDDVKVYLINKTDLTGIRYYSYYDQHVDFHLDNFTSSITVKEFLQYYFYATKNIQNLIERHLENQEIIHQSMHLLIDNWDTMKKINGDALTYYKQSSQEQSDFLILLTYLLYALFLVTLSVFLFFVNRFYSYIENKKENIIRLHSFLTHPSCSKLREISNGVRQCLAKSYVELETTLQVDLLRQGKQKSQYRYEKNSKYNYILLVFFVLMAVLNSFILYQIATLFTPATQMMGELTSLIQAENIAMQSYLQTKAMYTNNEDLNYNDSSMLQTMKMISTTEIQFAAASRSIEKTINIIGGSFADNFNNLLISDVCELTATKMPELFSHCQNLNYGTLQLGAVTTVSFIIRNVMGAMTQLMNNAANYSIFTSAVFQDIDHYIFYLFDIYQLLQGQIISCMRSIGDSIKASINIIIFFQITVLVSVLFVWMVRIGKEKRNLSDLYGQVLQLPQVIFRENKVILKILEENLTLKL